MGVVPSNINSRPNSMTFNQHRGPQPNVKHIGRRFQVFQDHHHSFYPRHVMAFKGQLRSYFTFFTTINSLNSDRRPFNLTRQQLFRMLTSMARQGTRFRRFQLRTTYTTRTRRRRRVKPLYRRRFMISVSIRTSIHRNFKIYHCVFVQGVISSQGSCRPISLSRHVRRHRVDEKRTGSTPHSHFRSLSNRAYQGLFSITSSRRHYFNILNTLPQVRCFRGHALPTFDASSLRTQNVKQFMRNFHVNICSYHIQYTKSGRNDHTGRSRVSYFFRGGPLGDLFTRAKYVIM